MQVVDLHVHSKFSRACSKQLDLEHIEAWSKIKGIDIVATGDYTHPAWIKELREKLEPQGNGFFSLRSKDTDAVKAELFAPPDSREVRFTLATEVSCIYSQGGAVRRIHLLVVFPELSNVKSFVAALEKRGAKLRADGRPILGMTAKDIANMALTINEHALVIPAHAWTPWFAIFGSKSGFDSVEECFEEFAPFIYALETGLSSDPAMNWRLSQNDRYTLVSNSDAHSLENLGREANVFDWPEVSYAQLFETIKTGDPKRFARTIEFFPEEGKYHLDGHAPCGFSCMPEETERLNGRCPSCAKKITVGVHARVAELADHPLGREPQSKIPYKSIVPLAEILADIQGVNKKSKKVMAVYRRLITRIGNEFFVLLEAPIEQIRQEGGALIAEAISRMRNGQVQVTGGYDGVYGTIRLFSEEEKKVIGQQTLI